MTYTTGSLIAVEDLNTVVENATNVSINSILPSNVAYPNDSLATNSLAALWGVGYGTRGFGQPYPQLNIRTNGQTILSSDWVNIVNVLNACATHTGTNLSGLPNNSSFAIGSTVSAVGFDWAAAIATIDSNRSVVNNLTMAKSQNPILTSSRGTSWTNSIYLESIVDFSSEDIARYFFNSGGKIVLDMSFVAGSTGVAPAPVTTVFTASYAIAIPPHIAGLTDVTSFTVDYLVAGGGGGGGGTDGGYGGSGGGGGSGGYYTNQTFSCSPGDILTVYIGDGGGGSIYNAYAGGDSSVYNNSTNTNILTATGGGYGVRGNNPQGTGGAGGAGGYPNGNAGSNGVGGTNDYSSENGGPGASSPFGSGGGGGDYNVLPPNGYDANGYGAGGGGGGYRDRSRIGTGSGGTGSQGIASITYQPPTPIYDSSQWQNLVSLVGEIGIGAHTTTTTGTSGIAANIGFYNLVDTSYTTLFSQYDTGSYSNNYIKISAKRIGYTGLNGGNGTGIDLKVEFVDAYSAIISGVMSVNISTYKSIKTLTVSDPIIYQIHGLDGSGTTPFYVFNDTVSGNVIDYNLLNRATNAGYTSNSAIYATITITSDGIIGSDSAIGTYAMTIPQLYPGSTVKIVNNGTIAGIGGNGGAGAPRGGLAGCGCQNGGDGTAGGNAILLQYPTVIYNYGTIGGGGGGGGGGGAECALNGGNGTSASAGAGGGGAGSNSGIGGTVNLCGNPATPGSIGLSGTVLTGGSGGHPGNIYTATGGNGGDLGMAGKNGQSITSAGGVGGLPGSAIVGVSNVILGSALNNIQGNTEFQLSYSGNISGTYNFTTGGSLPFTTSVVFSVTSVGLTVQSWSITPSVSNSIIPTISSIVGQPLEQQVVFSSIASTPVVYTGSFVITVVSTNGVTATLPVTVIHSYITA
jgi:hypothetical protein